MVVQLKEVKRTLLDELDINWVFTERETDVFRDMWKRRKSIEDIAKKLKRPPLEIGLLIIEQAELGNIGQRKRGIF